MVAFLPCDAVPAQCMLCSCVCPFVSVSISLSLLGVLPEWLNIGSWKECGTIAHGCEFSGAKDLG